MFLHTNRRIAALIGVICLALLIYCLVEREARRNLAPATKLDGLYAGRPAKPTAGLIFTALASLRLRTSTSDGTPEIPQPRPFSSDSSTYSRSTQDTHTERRQARQLPGRGTSDPPHLMCELRG